MKPREFVSSLLPFAVQCEQETGINRFVVLAQAALESGWGKRAPGNMYFGVKDTDGVNGNEQLLTTSEYSRRINCKPNEVGLVSIDSVSPVVIKGQQFFKYIGKGYFRKYDSPKDCFIDHTRVFQKPIYAEAMKVKSNPEAFIVTMAKHYATAPNYAESILSMYKQIKSYAG